MNTISDEAVKAARIARFVSIYGREPLPHEFDDPEEAGMRAAIAAADAVRDGEEAVPVAWRYLNPPDEGSTEWVASHWYDFPDDSIAAYERRGKRIEYAQALASKAQPSGGAVGALPERNPSRSNADQGLYRKFDVRRTDGSDATGEKHDGCEYFVLDLTHDPHAIPALCAYAQACASTHPRLSADILARYQTVAIAALSQPAPAAQNVPEGWEITSMTFLADALEKRGDDLSTDAASWLRKYAAPTPPSAGVEGEWK